jgi:hypothetical protein
MELLRKCKPSPHLLCARCRKPLVAFEVIEMRPVKLGTATSRIPPAW